MNSGEEETSNSSVPIIRTTVEFQKSVAEHPGKVTVVHFWAPWSEACKQMVEVSTELSKETTSDKIRFIQVEAESAPEISIEYNIVAVPTFIFLKNGEIFDRLDGAYAAELTKKVRQYKSGNVPLIPSKPKATVSSTTEQGGENQCQQTELKDRLKKLINSYKCMVFMKGSPSAPRCGFSKQLISLLDNLNGDYRTFDILEDESVRSGLKECSNWPTYPQIYINGELIGGLDIAKEMADSGELKDLLPQKVPLNARLESLIKKARVMVFMKGSPKEPRCKFSRSLMEILSDIGVEFESFDILNDEEVRQGLKEYSNWPTYPQVYVNGELIGGLDIIKPSERRIAKSTYDALCVSFEKISVWGKEESMGRVLSQFLADGVCLLDERCKELVIALLEKMRSVYTVVQESLFRLCTEFPSTVFVLTKCVESTFPFLMKPAFQIKDYFVNLMHITTWNPPEQLSSKIWSMLIDKLVELDVKSLAKVRNKSDESADAGFFQMDDLIKEEECDVTEKLDACLSSVLQFLTFWSHHSVDSSDENCIGANKEVVRSLYHSLLGPFNEFVLTTHDLRYTPYVWFYLCSCDPDLSDHFLHWLWRQVETPEGVDTTFKRHERKSHAAACYMSGLLARAEYIHVDVSQLVYCHHIIERNRRKNLYERDLLSVQTPFEGFFPFDPCDLRQCAKFIKPIYRDYQGLSEDTAGTAISEVVWNEQSQRVRRISEQQVVEDYDFIEEDDEGIIHKLLDTCSQKLVVM